MGTAIWTIVIFCTIIAIHEFGHFITAKLSGITVFEFAIGMGPKIFSFEKNGTKYSLRLLPIGGFCSMDGENGKSQNKNAFCNKSAWKRFLVLVSGAGMNVLLGIVIFVFLFAVSPAQPSNVVGEVVAGSAFEEAGIFVGDEIIRMKSENFSSTIKTYNDISFFVYQNQGAETEITLKRNEEKISVTVTPKIVEEGGTPIYGFKPAAFDKNFGNVMYLALCQSAFVVKVVLISFWQLITGTVPLTSVSGPVGIISEINSAAKVGFESVLSLAALISINLGIVNLFPLPALDGGRILFLIVEKIRKKPLSENREGMIHFIGLALLMLFALIVTFSDITKLFGA